MNFLERAIEALSPAWAAKREHARAKLDLVRTVSNSGYSHHGASRTKTSTVSWNSSSKSPGEDITENLELMRERSRDLYAGGAPMGRGAIERVVLNSVGPGLSLNCRVAGEYLGMSDEQAAEWERQVEREFGLWAESKDCDISRQQNFYELQNLCFRSVLVNGDALVLMPVNPLPDVLYDLRVGLVEGDRLNVPSPRPQGKIIDGGVELDGNGAPVAYWIANRHPLAEQSGQPRLDWQPVPAFGKKTGRRNILHLMPFERIGQHRGVPFLAPVIDTLKQLGRYTDAELMAAVVGGMYAIFFEHDIKDVEYGEEDYATDDGTEAPPGLEDLNLKEQMYGGAIDLPPGVEPKSLSPGRPNQAFDAFVMSLTRQIGSALGIPAELMFLHFTASYSASRGALLEAWKLFFYWRKWLATNLCQPIFFEWLCEAVLKGRVNAPGFFDDPMKAYAYSWAEWNGPTQGQLDPLKEVKAAEARVQNGFSTRQRETMELTGGDWELNHRQRVKEERMRRDAGLNEPTTGQAAKEEEKTDVDDTREE
ncbi:MAG: phage portal protein [Synergistaceae bacterium]|nr:phage portal protein [Synergistaceae bacterium]